MIINIPEASGGILPGVYRGKFVGVENVAANLEKGWKAGLKFIFQITQGEHAGKTVSRIVGIANGPQAALPAFLLGLMGSRPSVGALQLAPYYGKEYMLTYGEKRRVESVSPLA